MSSDYIDYYDGSKIFLFLSTKTGLPLDVVNFLIAQISALCLARPFRKSLRHHSAEFRHSICLLLGLGMGYFCFGKQAIHFSITPMLSYTLLKFAPRSSIGHSVLAVSMLYLSCLHLHRMLYHTADYSLDLTGPMMVITQRVTSVAYALQDGFTSSRSEDRQTAEQFSIERLPTPLEFFSYTLAFQTLMCGPIVLYSDYIRFIECNRVHMDRKSANQREMTPSPRSAVIFKVGSSIAAAVIYLIVTKRYPVTPLHDLQDPTSDLSRTWSPFYLMWYANIALFGVRCKYYHAWLLAEAICNNCGLGFNGYDADGSPKWDKLTNIDVTGFELSGNFRSAVSSWNRNTNAWLRYVAYTRPATWLPPTGRVYALSALWHGFYPGYYLTFLAGGLNTVAAKKVRQVIRPLFVADRTKKLVYDVMTFVTTRIAITYTAVPFVLLHLGPSLAFYSKFYYSLHFAAIGIILFPFRVAMTPSQTNLTSLTVKENGTAKNGISVQNGNGMVSEHGMTSKTE